MSQLLARLRSRGVSLPSARTDGQSAPQVSKHRATTLSQESPDGLRELPVQRRIHPDLNSLMSEFTEAPRSLNVSRPTSTRDHAAGVAGPVLTSLTPSTRRHSIGEAFQPHDPSGAVSASVSQEQLDEDGAPSTSGHTKWPTFGRGWGKGRDPPTLGDFGTFFPTSSGEVHSSETESRPQTPTTTSHSHSTPHSDAISPRSQGQMGPSGSPQQTFGIPTPPSSGMTFGPRQHILVDSPPPLPPLNHPAFSLFEQSDPETRIVSPASGFRNDRDIQHRPHLSSSLPTLRTSKSSTNQPKHRRAKTQPRNGSNIVSQPGPNTGTSDVLGRVHGSAMSRKARGGKRSIKRRFSAEYSSAQAMVHLPVTDGAIGGPVSWEAQVSQEMVRMSLNLKAKNIMAATEQGAGDSRFGQARGHNSIGLDTPASLGSPFLLQDSHSHNLSGILSDSNSLHSAVEAPAKPKDNMTASTANIDPPSKEKGKARETATPGSLSKNGGRRINSTTAMQSRSPSPPRVNLTFGSSAEQGSSSHLMPPILSFTAATPQPSPISPILQNQSKSSREPASALKIPSSPPVQRSTSEGSSKGKRKADEAGVGGGGGTPPKEGREHRATFAADPRPHRVSNNSSQHAPSSYHRKRARLSTTPESHPGSRDGSIKENTNAANTGSWSSRGSAKRAASSHHQSASNLPQRTPSRRSLSQASIPMSALISPHAPSISRSSTFHMRDPRKPAPIQSTPWSLSLPDAKTNASRWSFAGWVERGGSPLHAWLFFFGFLIFPIWWVAAFMTTPKTRRFGGNDTEKGVVLDDPQVEFDAKSWRTRCRVMGVISLFTYIPFIVLVAIFVPR